MRRLDNTYAGRTRAIRRPRTRCRAPARARARASPCHYAAARSAPAAARASCRAAHAAWRAPLLAQQRRYALISPVPRSAHKTPAAPLAFHAAISLLPAPAALPHFCWGTERLAGEDMVAYCAQTRLRQLPHEGGESAAFRRSHLKPDWGRRKAIVGRKDA